MGQFVIAVAQQKGGAGKTTVSAHMAVALSEMGWRVALIDIDPQASLTKWHNIREQRMSKGNTGLGFFSMSGWRINAALTQVRKDYDIIIIDSPPHVKTEAKAAIRSADLILVPVQPSPTDLWATQATLDLAKAEKSKANIVMNRVNPQSRIFNAIKSQLKGGITSILCNRVAYASSMMEGFGVTERNPDSPAATEVRNLAKEVTAMIPPSKNMSITADMDTAHTQHAPIKFESSHPARRVVHETV